MSLAVLPRLSTVDSLRDVFGLALTGEQQEVIATLKEWCLGPGDGSQAVLSGYAGTGKTTILQVLVLELLNEEPERSDWIWVTTPTHKATKVLAAKLREWEELAQTAVPDPCTIHSALALKPKRTKPYEPEGFVTSGQVRVPPGSLIIVDECSMVGAELYRIITEVGKNYGCRVLFTGDPKQLQPVNERRKSRTFDAPTKVELTKVLRHDGAILDLATLVRSTPRGAVPKIRARGSTESVVETHGTLDELVDRWVEALVDDPENVFFLCWTNKIRRLYNKRARQLLYGENVPDFMAGDKLVTLAAFERNGQVLLSNNADVEVESAKQTHHKPIDDLSYSYDCWELKLKNFGTVYVLADHAHTQFKADVKKLGEEIKGVNDKAKAEYDVVTQRLKKELKLSDRELQGHSALREARERVAAAKRRWSEEFFTLKHYFAEVDFGYAVTIHKSQGSTYQKVFIHNDYFNNKAERLQLLYVAVTRATKEVHHLLVDSGSR